MNQKKNQQPDADPSLHIPHFSANHSNNKSSPISSQNKKSHADRRTFLQRSLKVSSSAALLGSAVLRQVAEKNWVSPSLAGAAVSAIAGGCLTTSPAKAPEKVWGRRGFSPGRFLKPRAITIDPEDNLYIVDTTGRIQVFDAEGIFLRQWKTPETENGRPTGLGFQTGLLKPRKSAKSGELINQRTEEHDLEKTSRLLVADTHYYRMLSFTPDGQPLEEETIGGSAGHGSGQFAFVTDVACDSLGYRYIGEYNASDRIQKFDPDGNFVCQWGGSGRQPGSFLRPQSLVIRDNVLWVVDACNHRIQRFDISETTPKLIDIWGRAGEKQGEFYYPYDLAIASDGSVVVIEYKNNRLQRFSSDGKWIATWGGPGFEPGKLNQPWGVTIDSKDRVHILDSNNHRVQRIELPV